MPTGDIVQAVATVLSSAVAAGISVYVAAKTLRSETHAATQERLANEERRGSLAREDVHARLAALLAEIQSSMEISRAGSLTSLPQGAFQSAQSVVLAIPADVAILMSDYQQCLLRYNARVGRIIDYEAAEVTRGKAKEAQNATRHGQRFLVAAGKLDAAISSSLKNTTIR